MAMHTTTLVFTSTERSDSLRKIKSRRKPVDLLWAGLPEFGARGFARFGLGRALPES